MKLKPVEKPQLWVCRLKDTAWPKIKSPLPKPKDLVGANVSGRARGRALQDVILQLNEAEIDHLITARITAPCAAPGCEVRFADPAHVIGLQVWCQSHCPECKVPERRENAL